MRVHPFPSRTRQLSSSVLTILGWKRPGKIRRCRHNTPVKDSLTGSYFASLAQSVEHAAVNRRVVGSSPTGGAKGKTTRTGGFSFGIFFCIRTIALWLCKAACARSAACVLFTGSRTAAAGGRCRRCASRKKQGAMRALQAKQCDYVSDRWVVGSSPTGGAKGKATHMGGFSFGIFFCIRITALRLCSPVGVLHFHRSAFRGH